MNGKKLLTKTQGVWSIIILLILALIPIDPTDVLDAGTPIIEIIGMIIIALITKFKNSRRSFGRKRGRM